jgi:hypothetical protein
MLLIGLISQRITATHRGRLDNRDSTYMTPEPNSPFRNAPLLEWPEVFTPEPPAATLTKP